MTANSRLRRRVPGAHPSAAEPAGLWRLLVWPTVSAASRIVAANSIMLMGIVLLLCTALYLVLSGFNDRRAEERIAGSALSLASGPTVTRYVVAPVAERSVQTEDADSGATTAQGEATGQGQETGPDGDLPPLPAFVPDSNENAAVEERLEFTRIAYDFDLVAVLPASVLQTADGLGGTAGEAPDTAEAPVLTVSEGVDAPALTSVLTRSRVSELTSGDTQVRFLQDPVEMLVAVTPVASDEGEFLGAVVVGIEPDTVRAEFRPQLIAIAGFGLLTVVLGVLANWVTSRGLRRATGNYGTHEIGAVLEYYSSVLRAVSEGLLLVDRDRGIVFHNAEAADLLGLPEGSEDEPLPLDGLGLDVSLEHLLTEGRYARDEIHYTTDHVLVVNQQPAWESGTWVTTMRDHTELQGLIGELVSVRSFSESLRSQTHEYANRLHTIVSLMETGQFSEAAEFVTREISQLDRPADNLLDGFDHPVLSALLLTKYAQAGESGIALELDTEELTAYITADDRDLVTVVGNLVDNAFDAVSAASVPAERKRVRVRFAGNAVAGLVIEVSDDGHGIDEAALDQVFDRGWSTKHDGVEHGDGEGRSSVQSSRGVGLAIVVQAVRRMQGAIDVQGSGEELAEDALQAGLRQPLRGAMFTVWVPGESASDRRE